MPQNLLLQSQALQTTWSTGGGTSVVTADAGVAPDGTTTADRLTDTAANSVHALSQSAIPTVVGKVYTWSAYIKYESQVLILIAGNGGDGTAYAYFNSQTGALAGFLGTNFVGYSSTPMGNGWFRVSVTYVANVNATAPTFYMAQSVGVISYAGTGTNSLLIWGVQVEQSSGPGEYQVTTTAAVNPGAPAHRRNAQNLLNWTTTPGDSTGGHWTQSGATSITQNTGDTTAPDGTGTAAKFLETAATELHRFYQSAAAAKSRGAGGNVSTICAKKGTRKWCFFTSNDASGSIAWFDLDAGVVGSVQAGAYAQMAKAYQPDGSWNGWWRCSVLLAPTALAIGTGLSISFGLTSGDGVTLGVGDGTGTMYFWGPQAEYGDASGDYAPSAGAQVAFAQIAPGRKRNGQNLRLRSEAIATAPWADDGTATRTNNYGSVDDPRGLGLFASTRVQMAGGSTQYFYQPSTTSYQVGTYVHSVWMRATSASAVVRLRVKSGALNSDNTQGPDIALDTTWRRYSLVGATPNTFVGTTGFVIDGVLNGSANPACDFLVWGEALEMSNAACDYRSTTSVAWNPSGAPPKYRTAA